MLNLSDSKADKLDFINEMHKFGDLIRVVETNLTQTKDDLLTLENYCERYLPLQTIELIESAIGGVLQGEQRQ